MNQIDTMEGDWMAVEITQNSYIILHRRTQYSATFAFSYWQVEKAEWWFHPILRVRRCTHELLPAQFKFPLIDSQAKLRYPVVNTENDYLIVESRKIPIVKRTGGTAIPRKNCKILKVKSKHSLDELYPVLWKLKGGVSDIPGTLEGEDQAPNVPKHVAVALAEHASIKKDVCPITTNPISVETACVTSCFHLFESEALQTWLDSNNICPTCRVRNPSVTAAT